jgi:colicin import membrane protein
MTSEEAPSKRIEKILELAKTLREKSEKATPGKINTKKENVFMKKRDLKYQKKDKKSIMDTIFRKKPVPSSSLFDSNPFNKKPRFQKTLIATPSKFEIKVNKAPAKKTEKSETRSGIRGKLTKKLPAVKKIVPQTKVSLRSKLIKKDKKVPKEKVMKMLRDKTLKDKKRAAKLAKENAKKAKKEMIKAKKAEAEKQAQDEKKAQAETKALAEK